MNVLIDEMLNLAKYESGTYQIQMEQVNIVDLIQRQNKIYKFKLMKNPTNQIKYR